MIRRQLDQFEHDYAELLADCVRAERAYDHAPREEAEARYGDYVDLLDTGAELLAAARDNFASALDEDAAEEYGAAFNRAVGKRLPRFVVGLDDP